METIWSLVIGYHSNFLHQPNLGSIFIKAVVWYHGNHCNRVLFKASEQASQFQQYI